MMIKMKKMVRVMMMWVLMLMLVLSVILGKGLGSLKYGEIYEMLVKSKKVCVVMVNEVVEMLLGKRRGVVVDVR